MTSSFRPALLIILAIAIAVGVGTAVMAASTKQRGGSMGLLIDISRSNEGAKDKIKACATTAMKKAVQDGAELTISPVTSSTVYMETTPINSKLTLTVRLTSGKAKKLQAKKRAQARKRISEVLKSTVREDSSDTIAATAIMGRTLQQQPEPRTLVVCGDAHQVSPEFNSYREKNLTAQRSRELIQRVAPDLADLRDIDVIFGAAGLDTLSPFPNAREVAIARWWTDYWRPAVHARSLIYGSSIRFKS